MPADPEHGCVNVWSIKLNFTLVGWNLIYKSWGCIWVEESEGEREKDRQTDSIERKKEA